VRFRTKGELLHLDVSWRRENFLIKNYIVRNINTARRYIKTFIALVKITVSQKDTLLGPKLKFVAIIRMKIGPTRMPKCVQCRVVWFLVMQAL
jgi:hypothetical protein